VSRFKQRIVDRLRGQLTPERLVALGLVLGERTFIARNAYIDPGWPWLITIGDQATLGPGVIVLAHDASMQRHIRRTRIAPVVIGRRAFIGAGAIVLPGSTVGDDAIVGAGAVVRGRIPDGSVVIGNPATVVADVASMTQRHLDAAGAAPTWPHDGWTLLNGITTERKRIQREALAAGISGYLEWPERLTADEPSA
jgi:maltose O-acetyltransferase